MKTALVTGSDGFVGRNIIRKLVEAGYEVTGIDTQKTLDNGTAVTMKIDCRDYFKHSSKTYDLVVHAAARVGGRIGIEQTRTHLGAYNLQLDGKLFEWALKNRPQHLVCLSSSAVYPVELQRYGTTCSLHEADQDVYAPRLPDETYGWTKLTLERLAQEYMRETGKSCHIVRPFSGYGTDQSSVYPFGAFLKRVKTETEIFNVWGDGQQIRDWIHVYDICDAILAMVQNDIQGPVNLCTGIPTTFLELVNEFVSVYRTVTGRDYRPRKIETHPELPSGVAVRYGDATRMLEFYTPKISLEDGIKLGLTERK